MRLGILGSTRGTGLIPVIDAIKNKTLNAELILVVSNQSEALILEKAKLNGIHHEFLATKGLGRSAYDAMLSELFIQHRIDLIVLIGYMRILSANFVKAWSKKIINIHPSLLPAYSGLMDLEVHKAVIKANEKYSGCSVHYVTETVDAGPIICQLKCPVYINDTPELLKNRVQELEGKALIEAINTFQHPRFI